MSERWEEIPALAAAQATIAALTAENTGLKSSSGWVCEQMCEAAQHGGSCRCADLSNELPATTRERDEATTALALERTARMAAEALVGEAVVWLKARQTCEACVADIPLADYAPNWHDGCFDDGDPDCEGHECVAASEAERDWLARATVLTAERSEETL